MPTYIFEDPKTGEVFEKFMSWKDREEYLQDNPNLKPCVTAPNVIGGTGDRTKPPSGFNEVLSKVAEANPYSKLADSHGQKDSKSVARRRIAKKARKKFGSITGNS